MNEEQRLESEVRLRETAARIAAENVQRAREALQRFEADKRSALAQLSQARNALRDYRTGKNRR